MKKLVISIRDNKMESYNSPVLVDNEAVAIRQFGDIVQRGGDSVISLHPSDFTLYVVAEFDPITGKFANLDCPKALATGSDFENPKGDK